MKGRKLTLSIAAISLVASLNISSSGTSAVQDASSTGIWMKRASADSRPADTRRNGKVAFLRNRGGAVDVFVVNPSGMTPMNLTRSRANELYVDWSPNGRHVVFTRFGKGAGNLFRISRGGTGLRRLTSGAASDEAPGGRRTVLPSRSIGSSTTVRRMSSSSMRGGGRLPGSRPTRSVTTSAAGLRTERRSPSIATAQGREPADAVQRAATWGEGDGRGRAPRGYGPGPTRPRRCPSSGGER
jgi:hypothetical protein